MTEQDTPKANNNVHSFSLAVCYYKRYIKDFDNIARSLHKLRKNNTATKKIQWEEEAHESLDKLMQALSTALILGYMKERMTE